MTRRLEWIDADGGPLALDGSEGIYAGRGVMVSGLPPARVSTLDVPFVDGSRVTSITRGAREASVPVVISGADGAELEQRIDRLSRAIDPGRGLGRLRVHRHDGTSRELGAVYTGGLELVEQKADLDVLEALLIFSAPAPVWTAATQTLRTGYTGSSSTTFFPLLGVGAHLSSSESISPLSPWNAGDVAAPPVWHIHGPAERVQLRHLGSGAMLELETSLSATGSVDIDVEALTVRDGNGANLLPALVAGSELFHLEPGANQVEVTVSGLDPSTFVELSYAPRWLSA